MTRVLHFFKTYYPDTFGGIEQVIFQLAEGTRAHGVESQVLSLSPRGRIRDEQVGHHRAHCAKLDLELASTGFSVSAPGDFRRLAREVDLIHYHFPWPFMDLTHFLVRSGKPSVVTYHSDIVKQRHLMRLYSPLMHRFLGSVDRIVATSPNYLDSSPVLQRYRDKVEVIPIGLDESTYPVPDAARLARWRERFGERFFLFVGALRYYKGLHWLLDAVRHRDWPVVIVGGGPLEAELKAQARAAGLDNVHFTGMLPDEDKAALLTLCHALVFPSHLRSEAFGISLLEGAMYAKPLISCEIGTGTTYINRHDETGLVIPPADVPALTAAMDALWQDPERARLMGQAARRRYQALFTARQMADAHAALYRSLT